ncbi:MAG TPA: hypothetical protein VFB13_11490 [Reyranella sp.]|jgi:hypothetical protein|nr:hypothetical protein [Reyranella sp.]
MLPSTVRRVPDHTDPAINRRIRSRIVRRVMYFALHPEGIDERLRELDREWDIERTLEANAALLGLAGVALGSAGLRGGLRLSALVTGFLLQHAVQGWCPPMPLLRRLGIRTAREIEIERVALKALRGDFDEIGADGIRAVSAAAR